ncbi:MAG: type II toxin-antitoxin system RelE/ParE family toxin [Nanoarchaeota archaeon]
MYEIVLTDIAEKQFYKLNKQLQERIVSVLGRIKVRPYPHIVKLAGSKYYRLRVGIYRLILDVQEDKLIIYVIKIGKRENIYNKQPF